MQPNPQRMAAAERSAAPAAAKAAGVAQALFDHGLIEPWQLAALQRPWRILAGKPDTA